MELFGELEAVVAVNIAGDGAVALPADGHGLSGQLVKVLRGRLAGPLHELPAGRVHLNPLGGRRSIRSLQDRHPRLLLLPVHDPPTIHRLPVVRARTLHVHGPAEEDGEFLPIPVILSEFVSRSGSQAAA